MMASNMDTTPDTTDFATVFFGSEKELTMRDIEAARSEEELQALAKEHNVEYRTLDCLLFMRQQQVRLQRQQLQLQRQQLQLQQQQVQLQRLQQQLQQQQAPYSHDEAVNQLKLEPKSASKIKAHMPVWQQRAAQEAKVVHVANDILASDGVSGRYVVIAGGSGLGKTRLGLEMPRILREDTRFDDVHVGHIFCAVNDWVEGEPEDTFQTPQHDHQKETEALNLFGIGVLASSRSHQTLPTPDFPCYEHLRANPVECFKILRDLIVSEEGLTPDKKLFLVVQLDEFQDRGVMMVHLLQRISSLRSELRRLNIILFPILSGTHPDFVARFTAPNCAFAKHAVVVTLPPLTPDQARNFIVASVSRCEAIVKQDTAATSARSLQPTAATPGPYDAKGAFEQWKSSYDLTYIIRLCGCHPRLLEYVVTHLRGVLDKGEPIDRNHLLQIVSQRLMIDYTKEKFMTAYKGFEDVVIKYAYFGTKVQRSDMLHSSTPGAASKSIAELESSGFVFLKPTTEESTFQVWLPPLLLCYFRPEWFPFRLLVLASTPNELFFEMAMLYIHCATMRIKKRFGEKLLLREQYGEQARCNPKNDLLDMEVPVEKDPIIAEETFFEMEEYCVASGAKKNDFLCLEPRTKIAIREQQDLYTSGDVEHLNLLVHRRPRIDAEDNILPCTVEQFKWSYAVNQGKDDLSGEHFELEKLREEMRKGSAFCYHTRVVTSQRDKDAAHQEGYEDKQQEEERLYPEKMETRSRTAQPRPRPTPDNPEILRKPKPFVLITPKTIWNAKTGRAALDAELPLYSIVVSGVEAVSNLMGHFLDFSAIEVAILAKQQNLIDPQEDLDLLREAMNAPENIEEAANPTNNAPLARRLGPIFGRSDASALQKPLDSTPPSQSYNTMDDAYHVALRYHSPPWYRGAPDASSTSTATAAANTIVLPPQQQQQPFLPLKLPTETTTAGRKRQRGEPTDEDETLIKDLQSPPKSPRTN